MKKTDTLPILSVKTEKQMIGAFGERLARRYFLLHGYRILCRNYVARGHEIDLIVKKRGFVHFVEVKTRSAEAPNLSEPRPASAVTPEKQRAIISAAQYYIRSKKSVLPSDTRYSFDIVEVTYRTKTVLGKPRFRKASFSHLVGCFNRNTAAKSTSERS